MHSGLARTQPTLKAAERWSAMVYRSWKLTKSCTLARWDGGRDPLCGIWVSYSNTGWNTREGETESWYNVLTHNSKQTCQCLSCVGCLFNLLLPFLSLCWQETVDVTGVWSAQIQPSHWLFCAQTPKTKAKKEQRGFRVTTNVVSKFNYTYYFFFTSERKTKSANFCSDFLKLKLSLQSVLMG